MTLRLTITSYTVGEPAVCDLCEAVSQAEYVSPWALEDGWPVNLYRVTADGDLGEVDEDTAAKLASLRSGMTLCFACIVDNLGVLIGEDDPNGVLVE